MFDMNEKIIVTAKWLF